MTGTVIGMIILGGLTWRVTFLNVDAYDQEIIKGILIVSAVIVEQYRLKQRKKRLRQFCGSPPAAARLDCPCVVDRERGWVAEWFKAPVLKTGVGASLPGVRIPLHPPVANQTANPGGFSPG